MKITFDIISDLRLTEDSKFNWEDNVTSLFCIVAGNISSDLKIIQKTLTHLSSLYQGVFYIEGSLEHSVLSERNDKVSELEKICKSINNTVYLHNNVIVMNGLGIVAVNGWYGNYPTKILGDEILIETFRREDMIYLYNTLKKLQLHVDVKNIIVVSNSVPNKQLYFHEIEGFIDDIGPTLTLAADTEKKVKTWVFGTYNKKVDISLENINFIANPKIVNEPYFPKRIEI